MLILNGGFDVHLVHLREPVEVSDSKVVMLYRGRSCLVEAISRIVVNTDQTESIQTYTPAGNGLTRVDASIKSFDQDGKATSISKVFALRKRTSEFEPWDRMRGQDLRKLFNEYLESHGMRELCTK